MYVYDTHFGSVIIYLIFNDGDDDDNNDNNSSNNLKCFRYIKEIT
jgi:hypothetical protein